MVNLIQRQKEIVKILVNSNNYVTMKYISKLLKVSTRTILRDCKIIEKWFVENDFNLEIKSGVGLFVNESNEIRKYILELLNFKKHKVYSKKERKIIIIATLLYSVYPMKIEYFIKKLDVSKNTFDEDIEDIIKELNRFDLELKKKPGIGCYLEGTEENLRNCYLNMILDSFEDLDLIEGFKDILQCENHLNLTKLNILLKIFNKEELIYICDLVDENFKKSDFLLCDKSYVELIIQLAISIKRSHGKRFLLKENNNINKEHFKFIKNICMELEKKFNIMFTYDEILFLTENFKGLKFIKVSKVLDNNEFLKNIKNFIRLLEEDLKVTLEYDDKFLKDLLNHMEASFQRIKLKLNIENPFLHDIKIKYMEVYESVCRNIGYIEHKFNIEKIPDKEIGYISMYFSVLYEKVLKNVSINTVVCCHTGIGTSRILLKEIEHRFNNINVLEVIPYFKLREYKNKVDLIISTININTDIPYVRINPILNIENEKKLRNTVFQIAKHKIACEKNLNKLNWKNKENNLEILKLSNDIYSIISEYDHIVFEKQLSMCDILKIISEKITGGFKKDLLFDDLKERVNIQFPFFKELDLLYLHCASESIDNIKMLTYKFNKSIVYLGHEIIYGIALVIPKNSNIFQRELASEISISIVENEEFLKSIKRSNKDEILRIVKSFLLDFYKDKIKEII